MDGPAETKGVGAHPDIVREVVLRMRAERRLIEHELNRRRVLLGLGVLLPIVGVVLAAIGEPYIGGAFYGGGLVSALSTRFGSNGLDERLPTDRR